MRAGVATIVALSLAGCFAGGNEVVRAPPHPEPVRVLASEDFTALEPPNPPRSSVSLGNIGDGVLGGGVTRNMPTSRPVNGDHRPFFSVEMDSYVPPRGRGSSGYPYSWQGLREDAARQKGTPSCR